MTGRIHADYLLIQLFNSVSSLLRGLFPDITTIHEVLKTKQNNLFGVHE